MGVLIFGALVHANTVITNPKLYHTKCCMPQGLGLNTSHGHYRAMWDLIGLPHEQYLKNCDSVLGKAAERWLMDMETRGANYVLHAQGLRAAHCLFPYEQVIQAVQNYLFPRDFALHMRAERQRPWNHDVTQQEARDCLHEFYDDYLIEMRAQCRNVTHIAILP